MSSIDATKEIMKVAEAFPDPGLSPGLEPDCTCGECKELARFLRSNPSWREWTAADCFIAHTTSLMGVAFEYFLPAYICATYSNPDEADVAVDYSVWTFLSYPPQIRPNRALYDKYTKEQKEIILDWLSHYAETWSVDDKQMAGYLAQIDLLRG